MPSQKKLGFKLYNVINTKEQTIINSVKDTFEGENIQIQYSVLGYKIDLYFHEYKLEIEVDELGHTNRNVNNEIEYLLELILMKKILTFLKK